jgi:nicotinate-nucleotide adenylyltransferase
VTRAAPPALPGMRIGLFGGSFDPAHEGHAHVAETALKRLRLNRVWWMVTPQNPLKSKSGLLQERVASARAAARGSKMVVTDFEAHTGCDYTYKTIRYLKRRFPRTRFFLVMGADNLTNFHKWKNWREVAAAAPVAIVSRPGFGARQRLSAPKNWVFLNARFNPLSSTALRAARRRPVAKP